ncbi:MarR family transcriptional regulator [Thermomicrobium sp. CFH 73360]|uniref:MarR family winged helix-turn-helix transcriptional regulator n=1 Tax=Thermomicrobium sp. CFH 73360 TaxID=2951987 RepID=UPI0020767473|nr:MarR family transcriptional regulator [Thermomicrobium sp. CFH 73360]MCM8745047.1 MarR family transcriptional regulator [Thermomicrobium sp. CFH 73360]
MDDRLDLIETVIREMREVIAYLHRRSPPRLGEFDLSMAQLKVLFALSCSGPLTVSEVAERLSITSPTASHLIDRLVHLGLVRRREDERDRRRTVVELTASGEDFLRQLRQGNEQYWRDLLNQLDFVDLRALLQGVRALAEAARRARITN